MKQKEQKKEKRRHPGVIWWILTGIVFLLMLAVLELGKHTIFGWILAGVVFIGFAVVSAKVIPGASLAGRFGIWAGLFAACALILWVSWPPVQAVPAVEGATGGVTDIVHVAQGDLTGVRTADGQVEVYAGIPYARPPIGELRWREPEPAEAWEGVLAADHFGPMSMQATNLPIYNSLAHIIGYHEYKFSFSDNYRAPVSEDSLYLNIWKPAGKAENLPVLVYIHGGALQTGQPWFEDYSGMGLAREGVIVVNMAYRLGVFGFFADEELARESGNGTTGNYGLLDQILALRWVQENIRAFGGDPDNVTISGESAGSACVTALCTSPLAKGLFRRAVGESSTVTASEPAHSFRSMEDALSAGAATKEKFRAQTAADLRAVPAEKLAGEMATHHHMTVDGYVLPQKPYEAYAQGIYNEEAQMHGFNLDESASFILFSQANLGNYESKVRTAFKEPYGSRILELYPAATDAEARRNWANIYTAALFSYGHYCWEREALDNGIPSYPYYFIKQNGRLGAWHSGEEMYLYGNIPADSGLFDARDRELSEQMKGYFLNFIRSGNPNGEGLPEWPAGTGKNEIMIFGDSTGMGDAPYAELYAIFDELYGFKTRDQ